jgi:DNA-binding transcriptional ArsR family regulator
MTNSAKIRGNPRPHSPLDRLAVVFADPIRLEIVSELFLREMSPSGFAKIYGGGSASRVARHFSRLEEYGWLRFVREQPSGGRGRPQKLYRAAQLAIFEEDTWAQLPPPLREEFSWRIFQQFGERVQKALEAKTFDVRPERHFTWDPLVLDEPGRSTVLRIVTELFRALLEEQADARIRMHYSHEAPVHATAGLGAFDSPMGIRKGPDLLMPTATAPSAAQMDEQTFTSRFARVFNSEVNLKIVTELYLRPMSPSQFAAEFELCDANIRWRFELLEEFGWLERVKTLSGGIRHGGTEIFYRAMSPAIADTNSWSEMSPVDQAAGSWRIFTQLAEQVEEAFRARTFDARPDRHLTWTHLELDQFGWEKAIAAARQTFDDVRREQENAKVRLRVSGDEPVMALVYLAIFESPPPGIL